MLACLRDTDCSAIRISLSALLRGIMGQYFDSSWSSLHSGRSLFGTSCIGLVGEWIAHRPLAMSIVLAPSDQHLSTSERKDLSHVLSFLREHPKHAQCVRHRVHLQSRCFVGVDPIHPWICRTSIHILNRDRSHTPPTDMFGDDHQRSPRMQDILGGGVEFPTHNG